MIGRRARWSLGLALLLPVIAAAAEISVKDVATRPGVTQRVLVLKPEQPAGFVGLEAEVVKRIADWVKANSPARK